MSTLAQQVSRLDARIEKVQGQLDALLEERRQLLCGMIEMTAAELRALKSKAGITVNDSRRGRPAGSRSLTPDQVREIRAKRAAGVFVAHICDEYGLARPTIQKLLDGETYRDVV